MTVFNNFKPENRYKKILVHHDRVAQSEEQNEGQSIIDHRLKRLFAPIYSDGDITEGARCTVNAQTGDCSMEAGSIVIGGDVHDLVAASFVVPVVGTVLVGVVYRERIVTAIEDEKLYNPAKGTMGFGEQGADRLQVLTTWGVQGDGQPGSFYPVWTIEDGIVRPREPAPTMNATTQAIRRYDQESTGGYYVTSGLVTVQQPDDEQGRQVFTISAGAARVDGARVDCPADRRLVYAAVPDVEQVLGEPHNVDSAGTLAVTFNRWPVLQPAQVRIQRKKTEQVTHGPFLGAADPLEEKSPVKINSIKQGATTYTKDADYKLTDGQVDWSPGGAEPGPGTTYVVEYEYISVEPVLNQTPRGFEITGGVPQTIMYVDYSYALRRIDCIVIDADGALDVVKGIPATWQPVKPSIPPGVLALASINQMWDVATRRTEANAVHTVGMDVIAGYQAQHNQHRMDIAELRLATDVAGRYSGLKRGYFADPMIDNSMRDQGREQTAMISGGALQLFENHTAQALGDGVSSIGLAYTLSTVIAQTSSSRSMPINGTGAPGVLPATVLLSPAQDRWEVPKVLVYPRDINFVYQVGSKTSYAEEYQAQFDRMFDPSMLDLSDVFMREIDITFEISGFKPLEPLKSVSFDGVPVVPAALPGKNLVANASGVVAGKFRIPPGISIGVKVAEFTGENGSEGEARFTGGATVTVEVSGFTGLTSGSRGYGRRKVVTHV